MKRTTLIDYTMWILVQPLNNCTQQFIWYRKFEMEQTMSFSGTSIFKPAISLKGNIFITGSSFDQVLFLVSLRPLLLLPVSSSSAYVSEMLISAFDSSMLLLLMLTYCCCSLLLVDSLMIWCCSLVPALLSMISFSWEWEVWAASLVLQFWTPPLVLTGFFPRFEMPALVLIFYFVLKCLLLFW